MASLPALRPDTFRVWLPNPEALMSLKPTPVGTVPELTSYVARAAFPDGNPYLSVRDALGTFYDDRRFAGLFPDRGRPAEAPWRLALVTVLPFAEGLSDRQAAEAVRARSDWKYAPGLEVTAAGFGCSVLSEFRAPGRGRRRARAAGCAPGRVSGARVPQGARAAAGRLDARARGAARPESAGARRGDAAAGAGRHRGGRAGVAPRGGSGGGVRALRRAGRGVTPAARPGGAPGIRRGGGGRRATPARGSLGVVRAVDAPSAAGG